MPELVHSDLLLKNDLVKRTAVARGEFLQPLQWIPVETADSYSAVYLSQMIAREPGLAPEPRNADPCLGSRRANPQLSDGVRDCQPLAISKRGGWTQN